MVSAGTTAQAYDDLNRLTSLSRGGKTVGFAYDAANNRASLTYSNGNVVTYGYDSRNRVTTVTDWNSLSSSFTYDQSGQVTHGELSALSGQPSAFRIRGSTLLASPWRPGSADSGTWVPSSTLPGAPGLNRKGAKSAKRRQI